MKRTNVVEFITNLDDGGAETLVKDYALLMDKEKFNLSIVVYHTAAHSANLKKLQEENTRIHTIYPRWNFFFRMLHKFGKRIYVPYRLKKILQEEHADVLHVHLALLRFLPPIIGKFKNIRLFYTCHNLPEEFFAGRNIIEKKAAQRLVLRNNLQLISLHREMAEELNKMFGIQNTVVIRNGVNFDKFKSTAVTKEEKRNEVNIPQEAFVLGHVGRFAEQKNHRFLVEVFREVAARNRNAFLLMVGAGDTAPTIGKLDEYGLSDRYQILSNRGDIHELMKAMDVFVFPSLFEGLGIVLIEAQVSGLRCVISDRVPEEAIKATSVVSLSLEDPSRWADVILDLNAQGNKSGNLSDYDMNKEIKRLEKLYSGEFDG